MTIAREEFADATQRAVEARRGEPDPMGQWCEGVGIDAEAFNAWAEDFAGNVEDDAMAAIARAGSVKGALRPALLVGFQVGWICCLLYCQLPEVEGP